MAEYLAVAEQNVSLNNPFLFTASIPCNKGYIYHEDETGIFILRGKTENCFARYSVTVNGNIAVPEGGNVGSIAIGLTVNGEPRPSSKAIVTPAAVSQYFNVTSTAIITVPRGCCFSVSVRYLDGTNEQNTTTTSINGKNMNIVINRIA